MFRPKDENPFFSVRLSAQIEENVYQKLLENKHSAFRCVLFFYVILFWECLLTRLPH